MRRRFARGRRPGRGAFSLLELLVVMGIIGLLMGIVVPSIGSARESGRRTRCLAHLHNLGLMVRMYQGDHDEQFPPYRRFHWPVTGRITYFWGSNEAPVNRQASWLLPYGQHLLETFWCPAMDWGSYVPQGVVNEPTTTYGYNAWYCDPSLWQGKDAWMMPGTLRRSTDPRQPAELFVFADAAMYWKPGAVEILQNSTSLDPVMTSFGPNLTPTTHFRHRGNVNALCADGHAASFGREGGPMPAPQHQLGFVGPANAPHYDDN